LSGPTDRDLNTLAGGQRGLGREEHPLAANIQGLAHAELDFSLAAQQFVPQFSRDREPIVAPAIGLSRSNRKQIL
jgi:hypothetical protein